MLDDLGDRMKLYESAEAGRRLMPLLPALARLDGRAFHTFTRGMRRPYDERLSRAMVATTMFLVEETNAIVGYTQSDEITLCWHSTDPKSQIFFDGRIQKMCSVLAAMCSAKFASVFEDRFCDEPERVAQAGSKPPVFDCRVWNVPTAEEAANVFLWRELDATKNAVQMAAQSIFSHKELQGKNGAEMQEMLFAKGINFNDYPAFFKRGTFVRRVVVKKKLSTDELDSLPPKHHARQNPDMEFERSVIGPVDLPPLLKVANRVGVMFGGEEPRI